MRSFDLAAEEHLHESPLKALCSEQSADDSHARNHSTYISQRFTEDSTNIFSTQKESPLRKSIYCSYRQLHINKQLLSDNKESTQAISQHSAKLQSRHPLNSTVKPMQFASHPYLSPHKAAYHPKLQNNKYTDKTKDDHLHTNGINKSLKTNYKISIKIQPAYLFYQERNIN